jgi:hypothetical protein
MKFFYPNILFSWSEHFLPIISDSAPIYMWYESVIYSSGLRTSTQKPHEELEWYDSHRSFNFIEIAQPREKKSPTKPQKVWIESLSVNYSSTVQGAQS